METRNLRKYDRFLFRNDVQQVDWESILNFGNNCDKMTNTFQENFQSILDIHAPIKKKRQHSHTVPWMTPLIRELILKRGAAKKDAEKSPAMWNSYKKLRNQVTKRIREAIRSHYQGSIEDNRNNPKRVWKAINKVLDKDSTSTEIPSLNVQGKMLTRERDIAQALNHHFVIVGLKLSTKTESLPDDDPVSYFKIRTNHLIFTPFSVTTVLNAIKNLKNGTSPGPDGVSTVLIKDAANIICSSLATIYNSSVESGTFPAFWKLARVTPIFKSGNRNDAKNYRPISIIFVFARIFERIIHDQLYDSLKKHHSDTKSIRLS